MNTNKNSQKSSVMADIRQNPFTGLFNFFFNPNGRIGRFEYLIGSIAIILGVALFKKMDINIPAIFYFMILSLPVFVLTIKRLHDQNVSGYWSLFLAVPLLNLAVVFCSLYFKGYTVSNYYDKSKNLNSEELSPLKS